MNNNQTGGGKKYIVFLLLAALGFVSFASPKMDFNSFLIEDVNPLQVTLTPSTPTCTQPNVVVDIDTDGVLPLTVTFTGGAGVYSPVLGLIANMDCNTTYSITVTDATGCTNTQNITTPPCVVFPSITAAITNETCAGSNNGAIDVTLSNTTGAVAYFWLDSVFTEDRTGLAAGTYTLFWQDSVGCSGNETYVVGTDGLQVDFTLSTPTCTQPSVVASFDTNGTLPLNVTVNGGPGVYSPVLSLIANMACNTTYTITVTDANGCTNTQTLTTPPCVVPPTATAVITNETCPGAGNGEIDVTVTGATGVVNYIWLDGVFTEDRAGLTAGTYSLWWQDSAGCNGLETYVVGIEGFQANWTFSTPTCQNPDVLGTLNTNGESPLAVTFTGGPGTYSSIFEVIVNMACNTTYTITVTDANGCTDIQTLTTPPCAIIPTATAVITNETCPGANNGEIDVTITGATNPVNYIWLDGPTTEDRVNLPAGTYTLWWQDDLGCNGLETYVVGSDTFEFELTFSTPSCSNQDVLGTMTTNGESPLNVTISGGAGTFSTIFEVIVNMQCNTNYSITVTDANGCTSTQTFTTPPCAIIPTATAVITNETCPGANDGEIDVTITGATNPVNYIWLDGPTTEDRVNLPAGTYTLWWQDDLGCNGLETYIVEVGECGGEVMCELIPDDLLSSNQINRGYDVTMHDDDSYTIVGSMSASAFDRDQYLVQRDALDIMQFNELFGDNGSGIINEEEALSVVNIGDRVFTAGVAYQNGSGNDNDMVVTCYDPNNTSNSWKRTYDIQNTNDVATSIIHFQDPITQTDLLAVAGNSDGVNFGSMNMFIMILDPATGLPLGSGTNPLRRVIDISQGEDYCNDLVFNENNQMFSLVGRRGPRAMVVNIAWPLPPGPVNAAVAYNNAEFNAVTLNNNQLFMTGTAQMPGPGTSMVVASANANTLAFNNVNHYNTSTSGTMTGNDILLSSSGNIHVVGSVRIGANDQGYVARLLASNLSLQSANRTNDPNAEAALFAIKEESSGQFLMVGNHEFNNSAGELFVVRSEADGTSCCMDPFQVVNLPINNTFPIPAEAKGGAMNINLFTDGTTLYNEESICSEFKMAENPFINESTELLSEVYPNPTTGIVTLALNESSALIASIEVIDGNGRVILNQNSIHLQRTKLDLGHVESGLYLIRIQTEDGEVFTHRIVKQ